MQASDATNTSIPSGTKEEEFGERPKLTLESIGANRVHSLVVGEDNVYLTTKCGDSLTSIVSEWKQMKSKPILADRLHLDYTVFWKDVNRFLLPWSERRKTKKTKIPSFQTFIYPPPLIEHTEMHKDNISDRKSLIFGCKYFPRKFIVKTLQKWKEDPSKLDLVIVGWKKEIYNRAELMKTINAKWLGHKMRHIWRASNHDKSLFASAIIDQHLEAARNHCAKHPNFSLDEPHNKHKAKILYDAIINLSEHYVKRMKASQYSREYLEKMEKVKRKKIKYKSQKEPLIVRLLKKVSAEPRILFTIANVVKKTLKLHRDYQRDTKPTQEEMDISLNIHVDRVNSISMNLNSLTRYVAKNPEVKLTIMRDIYDELQRNTTLESTWSNEKDVKDRAVQTEAEIYKSSQMQTNLKEKTDHRFGERFTAQDRTELKKNEVRMSTRSRRKGVKDAAVQTELETYKSHQMETVHRGDQLRKGFEQSTLQDKNDLQESTIVISSEKKTKDFVDMYVLISDGGKHMAVISISDISIAIHCGFKHGKNVASVLKKAFEFVTQTKNDYYAIDSHRLNI